MAFLGPIEAARVLLLRPDVHAKLVALMQAYEDRTGNHATVPDQGGYRTNATQAAIAADSLAQGFRAAPAGESPHEFGAAFDLHIVGFTTGDPAKDKANPQYAILAEEAVKLGLRAGASFKKGLPDPYHFDTGETLDVMEAKWRAVVDARVAVLGKTFGVVGVVLVVFGLLKVLRHGI